MSDIHGQYDLFLQMLEKINFSDKDTLYILGDIIDRGPQPLEIYDYIKDKENIILLLGNHEEMFNNYYSETIQRTPWHTRNDDYRLWIANGGKTTETAFLARPSDEQEEIKNYLANLPYYKIVEVNDKKYILSHARPIIRKNSSEELSEEDLREYIEQQLQENIKDRTIVWGRDFSKYRMNNGYRIIHGHTPVQYIFGNDVITAYSFGEVIDIDCGCAIPSTLACLRLDDFKQFYLNKT